jgi:sec-independent protein translocase protein TatA
MGPLGVQEMIFIFILALILFGPKKLPELGRMLGKAVSEFRRAKNELRSTWEAHMAELERETRQSTPYTGYRGPAATDYSTDYSHARHAYRYDDYDHYGAEQQPVEHAEPQASEMKAIEVGAPATEPPAHEAPPPSAPVPGTIARSNGSGSAHGNVIPASEEHPAA